MRRPPKECRKSHTDDHDNHFFKVLIGDFHKRLVIPVKFAHHFRGKTGRSIKLEAYGGYTFDVWVAENAGKVALQFGWESFVRAHDLKMFDFLVFNYDGISQMKVLIFDPSGCEKMAPCFVTKNATSGGQRREEPIDISDNSTTLPMRTPNTEKKAWKQRDRSKINIRSSSSPSKSSGSSTSSEDHEARSVPSYILPQRTKLSNVQKNKLKEKVRAICSEIPIYGCVMNKTNVSDKYRSMDFCAEYAQTYLPFKERTVMLRCHGKSWEVMGRIRQVSRSRRKFKTLRKGWAQFAGDNKLQLGDLCLFEPLKTKKHTMNVHIIRTK
ncbi:hypothetical protein BS78_01G151500 [Paspalum vaginatum]|nr:hypothetical protein BS78_01G151500 [Paspalum vaginatum]KAJ1294508.1 hypothetical protein BS78_01G151500 [Paspalum vaginatum]